MARIICPNCGETIEVDPSQVEDLTRQLRDELFAHDLEARLSEAGHLHQAQEQTAREEERREADRRVAEVQAQVVQLQAQLKEAAQQNELAVQQERADAGKELARLQAQLEAAAKQGEMAVEQERTAAHEELLRLQAQLEAEVQQRELAVQQERAAAGEELARLQAQLEGASREQELAVQQAQASSAQELAQQKAQAEAAAHQAELELQRLRTQAAEQQAALQHQIDELQAQAHEQMYEAEERARVREADLAGQLARVQAQLEARDASLKTQLEAQELSLKAQAQADVLKATAQLERDYGQLEAQLKVEQANSQKVQADLREQMAVREGELAQRAEEQLEAKNQQIEQYKAEVERLRDYRMRLSTKLIGESLEHHCQNEFNRIRMQAYPRALFEKDNEAVGGTKGDFIFRDYDDDGNELLSIMFEMKNEEELSAATSRKRNEDHFKKLDADRTKKNCEYAVLVSTLEPDNEFYNAGIADVSWQYPKMFVVRPQCFTTIIGLLKAAALAAHPYRLQLERARQEELDVTKFEEKVTTIVDGIANDYALASKNYEQAEKDIDAIIAKLQHLKGQLGIAAKHFGTASKRGDKLSIKRLTWGNQTMKAAFAQAEAEREAADQDEDELPEADLPLDPDELE